MQTNSFYKTCNTLLHMFETANITKDITLDFIAKNKTLIQSIENFHEHLYFITGEDSVYGIVIIEGDFYRWSVLKQNGFTPFQEYTDDDHEFLRTCDYIVELVLGYPDEPGVKENLPFDTSTMTLEDKIKSLCKTNYSAPRYNISN